MSDLFDKDYAEMTTEEQTAAVAWARDILAADYEARVAWSITYLTGRVRHGSLRTVASLDDAIDDTTRASVGTLPARLVGVLASPNIRPTTHHNDDPLYQTFYGIARLLLRHDLRVRLAPLRAMVAREEPPTPAMAPAPQSSPSPSP